MKLTLLLTGYTDNLAYIGDLTAPLMQAYAKNHRVDFYCNRRFDADSHPAWQKLEIVLDAFDAGYERVFWLDADVAITNPDIPPPAASTGLHCSRDWGQDACPQDFSSGVFFACADSRHVFEEAQKQVEFKWADYYDQGALRQVHGNLRWVRKMIYIYPRRSFNSVHESVVGVVDPWQKGDFVCHLTALSPERRVEVFHEIIGGSKS